MEQEVRSMRSRSAVLAPPQDVGRRRDVGKSFLREETNFALFTLVEIPFLHFIVENVWTTFMIL